MYRKAIGFIFLLLVLYNATSAVWINAAFFLNRDYVAENLCEAREVLDNACRGECVLMKKLRESQEKDNEPASAKMQELQLVFLQNTWQLILNTAPVTSYDTTTPVLVQVSYTDSFAPAVFRPPIA